MTSRPFESFVAPARARPQLWRLAVGLILALAVYMLWVAAVFVAFWAGSGFPADPAWLEGAMAADTPRSMMVILLTFLGMALGPMAAARLMHKRPAGTLFGPAARTLRDFAVAAALTGGILGASLLGWLVFFDPIPNLAFGQWLILLPAALGLLVIQTGAEELLFRGYLQQQLGARFSSPFAWLVVPSVIFGLFHFDPASTGENVWHVVGSTAIFGMAAADLTARTGSIGAAWGFHFANNTVALLLVATQGQLGGLALYLTPYAIDDAEGLSGLMLVDLGFLVLIWAVLRRLLGR